ncbi:MAG: PAS domain-containing sensor histidine kinase [Campylobacterota bacterium]|nr:PAS domain-containing sensor histidine kinase [Campylobacterota bacterium]
MIKFILKYKYFLVALLVGISYYTIQIILQPKGFQNEYSKILNISGKQRMLSQRLIVVSTIYYTEKTKESKKELENILKEIEFAHKYLIKKIFTKKLENIYFNDGIDKNLKIYLSNFYNLLKTDDKKYIVQARDNSKIILLQLDSAVKAYEIYIHKKIKDVDKYKDIMIVGILIAIIILLFLFIELRNQLKSNNTLSKELQKTIDIISEYVIFSKTDLKGNITDASDAFCDISGYTKDELIGQPHNIIRHPDMPSSAFKDMWKTIKTGKVWQGEVKNLKKDGNYYWATATISPEYDNNSKISGYMAIRHDITSKKDFEKQHLQLIESEKMASMGEMIGNIAHQWRQPLSTISTAASGMQIQKEYNILTDESFNENCELINENAQYLSQTIDTFRNFIKGEKLYKEIVIQDEITDALNIAFPTLKDNRITVKDNINYKDQVKITMNTGELPQVIINILNNAKDILLEKKISKPWIKLDFEKGENSIIITIEDNGGGVPDQILTKIFDPYFTTKHKSQGTGLGLHMSYSIVHDSLKGKLYVKNSENGAKFFIELPLDTSV